MKNFQEFIAEGRDAPLYHSTALGLVSQIERNGIAPVTIQHKRKLLKYPYDNRISHHQISEIGSSIHSKEDDFLKGVSTTRDFEFASVFNTTVLELDQRRLAQRYEIIPVNYFAKGSDYNPKGVARADPSTNEYEEFVVTNKPIPFSYVNRIYVRSKDLIFREVSHLRDKYGASFIVIYK